MLYMSKHKPVATVRTGRHLFTHTHFGSEMNVKIIMTSKKSFGKKVENSIVCIKQLFCTGGMEPLYYRNYMERY